MADTDKAAWIKRVLGIDTGFGSGSLDTKALTARLMTLRDAIVAAGDAAAPLLGQVRGAADAIRAGSAEAPKLLVALDAGLAALTKTTTAPTIDEAALVNQLKELSYEAHAAGLLPTIVGDIRAAQAAVKEKRADAPALVEAARAKFTALQADAPGAAGEQRRQHAADEIAKGKVNAKTSVVAFAKIRLKLLEVESAVDLGSERLKQAYQAMLESDLFEGEDDLVNDPELQAAIDAAPAEQIPDFAATAALVKAKLDDIANAAGEARAKLAADAAKEVAKYRSALTIADAAKEMENSEGGSFPILEPIVAALADLESALTA